MSLVFDWGDSTCLNQVYVIWKIWLIGVEDLVEVLDSTFFTLIGSTSAEAKDGYVLLARPVRELVVSKDEGGTISGVVIIYDSVPMNELLFSKSKLFDFLI